jgi:putative ABC transport system permease protein
LVATIVKKSYRDLSKKKARTFFTVITIALGVMGMSLFAVTPLADEGVLDEIDKANMHNVQISVLDVQLDQSNFNELEALDNINLMEARLLFLTKVKIGNRWNNAIMLGIDDYSNQKVNIINPTSGSVPGDFEVLTENANAVAGIHEWKNGNNIIVKDFSGAEQSLLVTGVGKSLATSGSAQGGFAVFYSTTGTIRALGNLTGYNYLAFDLEDTDDTSIESSVEEIRDYLTSETSVVAFANLPNIRREGEWAGSEFLAQLVSFMYILTMLALVSSVFLISNTMNTIISEQKKEIAQMKAIGATKMQVFRSFLTSSIILGVLGALIGAIFGIFISSFVLNAMGAPFGFDLPFMIHLPTVIISFVVGILVVIGASLPALVRSSRVTVREGLESHGISGKYGKGALSNLFKKSNRIPRTLQMGMRNVSRKKGRSAVTVIQVTMAVGIFLGLVSFGYSLQIAVAGAWSDRSWDILVYSEGSGGNPLTEDEGFTIENINGVDFVEPFVLTNAHINDRFLQIWGYVHNTESWDHQGTLSKGEWFSQEHHDSNASVLVIGEALAEFENIDVGDSVEVMTATGSTTFTIIGLQSSLMDNGQSVLAPISSLQRILRVGNIVSGFFIHTTSSNHDEIDTVSTEIEETMLDSGYVLNNQIHYVMEERNQAQNAGMMFLFMIVSLLIVFISMIGLMSTLTMGILERTKEIGMMRCIGSKASHIRAVFGSEGIFLALIGWIIGVPVGFLLGVYIANAVSSSMNLHMDFVFPPIYIVYSFLIAMVGTFVIIQAPLIRAVRFKPGDALRYQ